MSAGWKPTAADLVAALREYFTPPHLIKAGKDEWSLLTQVWSTGSPVHDVPMPAADASTEEWQAWRHAGKTRAIDVLLVRNWRSGKVAFERVAVEIKVSRADFFRDTAAKRAPWESLTHRFAYCVPEGLIAPAEVPDGCWLIEVSEANCTPKQGPVHARHEYAPRRVHWHPSVRGQRRSNPTELPGDFTVGLAREVSRVHALGAIEQDGESTERVAHLERELRRAKNRILAMEQRVIRDRDRVAKMRALIAPLGPQVCADCQATITPHVGQNGRATWAHRTREAENACALARIQQNGRWASGWDVEPLSVRQDREESAAADAELADQLEALEQRSL